MSIIKRGPSAPLAVRIIAQLRTELRLRLRSAATPNYNFTSWCRLGAVEPVVRPPHSEGDGDNWRRLSEGGEPDGICREEERSRNGELTPP